MNVGPVVRQERAEGMMGLAAIVFDNRPAGPARPVPAPQFVGLVTAFALGVIKDAVVAQVQKRVLWHSHRVPDDPAAERSYIIEYAAQVLEPVGNVMDDDAAGRLGCGLNFPMMVWDSVPFR